MKNTGKYATAEQIAEIKEIVAKAQIAGFVASRFGPSGADAFYRQASEKVHKYALASGLPEIEGFYGLAGDGEFVTINP